MADNGGGGPADSYIGSLISLTSKSAIRYEGFLYTVDTENSNIALQNVRSFGTEGRTKDGPQIPASEKVYDFIIFRGTDIKDLQVKISPPPPIHNDPAIISLQAQASQPLSAPPPYVPPAGELNGHHSTYKATSAPYYHSTSSGVPLWAPPPPSQLPSGNMPLYWQGFYGPPDQHRLMEPPSVSAPAPTVSQAISVPLAPATQLALAPSGQEQILSPPVAGSTFTLSPPSHSLVTPDLSCRGSMGVPALEPMHPNHLGPMTPLPFSSSQPSSLYSPNAVSSGHEHEGTGADIQRSKRDAVKVQFRPGVSSVEPSGVSSSAMLSPAPSTIQRGSFVPGRGPMVYKQVNKQMQVSKDHLNFGQQISASKLQSPSARPLLPLPNSPTQHKPSLQIREGVSKNTPIKRGDRRGRGMARAGRSAYSGFKLLEAFDFTAMNEKFNKEEVWDELLKVESKDRVSDETGASQGLDYSLECKDVERHFDGSPSDLSRRSVYVKDDFFDSLSCDSLERERGKQERVKFAEQRKIDAETFGSSQIRSYRGSGGYRGRRGGSGGRRSVGRGQGHAFGHYNVSRGNGRAGPAG